MPGGAESYADYGPPMPEKRAKRLAIPRIPDPHGLIPADRGEHPPVRAISHPPADIGVMAVERVDPPASRRVEDACGPVLAGRGERLPFRAVRDVEDIIIMRGNRQEGRLAQPPQ